MVHQTEASLILSQERLAAGRGAERDTLFFFFFSVKDEDVHCSLARVQFSLPVFPTKLDLLPLSHPPEFYIITTRELGP